MLKMDSSSIIDIVIIGGGIGGTALSLILSRIHGITVHCYEKDESFHQRKQGYGLTIQHHDALNILGFQQQARKEDTINDAHFIFEPQGLLISAFGRFLDHMQAINHTTEGKRYNIHLPRQRLREFLVDGVETIRPGGVMQWGWVCESFTVTTTTTAPPPTHPVHVILRHVVTGAVKLVQARLLVGADGIHSVIRKQLVSTHHEDALHYLGMLVVLGMTPCEDPICMRTTFQMLDGTTRLFTMPFTSAEHGKPNVTFWQLSFPVPLERAIFLKNDLGALRAEILARCAAWHEPVPSLLRNAQDDMITATPVYDRGESFPFLSSQVKALPPGLVTLIGDAAHPMSPFKGQGANTALLDAVELGKALATWFGRGLKDDLPTIVRRFEKQMYERSERKVQGSRSTAQRLHTVAAHDPSTRGVSPELSQLFRDRGVGLWSGVALRKDVIDCVRTLKDQQQREEGKREEEEKKKKEEEEEV